MSYIYDILANFNDFFYDFFDWDSNDSIVHIKKLPILRVSSDFFNNVKFNNVFVKSDLLEKIFKKAEFFKINKNKYSYVCSLCDGKEAFIVRFDCKGNVIGRSSMLIDEENEVIDICESLDVCSFDLIICSLNVHNCFNTRKEFLIKKNIVDELNSMDSDKLIFLYYDCFDEHERDVSKIVNRLVFEINNDFNSIYGRISDFLKLTSINK